MSRKDRLLKYLQSGRRITRLTAFTEIGIFELSSRIGDLREEYDIEDQWKTVYNRWGEKYRVKEYWIPQGQGVLL